MRKSGLLVVFIVMFIVLSSLSVKAVPTYVISNSQDWRDVYSSEIYANLIGSTPWFLVSSRHSAILVHQLDKINSSALVVSSKSLPYVFNYASTLKTNNIDANEIIPNNVNLELADKLNVTNFIILDDNYGYNAVSVAPYAMVKKAYVLFADKNNIDDVVHFLATRKKLDELLIYGIVDRQVIDSLKSFNPTIINSGDRFSDNIEIVKKYLEVKPNEQAIFTDGEFLEKEILSGSNPVIFIGRQNVPDAVKKYIKNSQIKIGVLIGNELVGSATLLRRSLGISVFVKFAQSARVPSGPISKVEALDMFYLPIYKVLLDAVSIAYNSATNLIEITYQNTGQIAGYFKGSFTISGSNGERQVVGDTDPVFIESGAIKTMTYQVDPFTSKNLSARAFIIYGESPKSLEFTIDRTIPLTTVSVVDATSLNITSVSYDAKNGEFIVEIENLGEKDAYFNIEIDGLKVGYEIKNYGLQGNELIRAGQKKKVKIKAEDFLPVDYPKNKNVKVKLFYGQRKNALVHSFIGEFELQEVKSNYLIWILVSVIVILLFIFILLKMRVKCDNCGHRNFIFRSKCKKCGHDLG